MSAARHALILGAGVFGVTAALSLRRRGFRVTLCDPGPLPHPLASSTDISKLIRMDYGSDDLIMDWMAGALSGWDAWNAGWRAQGRAPLYHEEGILILSRDPMAPGGFEGESFERLQARGLSPERLVGDALQRRFSAWAPGVHVDGYFNPRAGWAESGAVIAALIGQARVEGVELREGCGALGLIERRGRVVGARTSGEELAADHVIVAAGVWTPTLLPELSDRMWPVAQPVLHFRVEDPARFRAPTFSPWAADIGRTGWYGFPALPDGTLKVANHGPGWRLDPDGLREVPAAAEGHARAFLAEALPELASSALIGQRLCLYCDTWDGDFFIDHHPDRPGLVVASGGSGHAFKFAPALGALIADVVEGRDHPFRARVAWRAPGDRRFEDARHQG